MLPIWLIEFHVANGRDPRPDEVTVEQRQSCWRMLGDKKSLMNDKERERVRKIAEGR